MKKLSMTHRLTTNYAKNYCNRTLIVKVIVENVVNCFFFWGGGQCIMASKCRKTVKFEVFNCGFSGR